MVLTEAGLSSVGNGLEKTHGWRRSNDFSFFGGHQRTLIISFSVDAARASLSEFDLQRVHMIREQQCRKSCIIAWLTGEFRRRIPHHAA